MTLDYALLAGSGQMFRWNHSGGRWFALDGTKRMWMDGPWDEDRGRLLREDWNWPEVHARVATIDPILGEAQARLPGLILLRPGDRIEALFAFLCASNCHLARIGQMVGALASFGEVRCDREGSYRAFPSLPWLAEVTEESLWASGFGYRARTIPRAARQLAGAGDAYLDDLARASTPDLVKELMGLPGVGRKLADCIALYAFDRTESVPVDVHLRAAVVRRYRPDLRDRSLTPAVYAAIAAEVQDRYGMLSGYTQLLLYFDEMKRNITQKSNVEIAAIDPLLT